MAYNPREDDEEYFLTGLLDTVENGVIGSVNWLQKQAEDNPDTWTDDAFRLAGGGLKNSAWALSKIPGLKQLGQAEDFLADKARNLSENLTPWLDPRVAGWGTRIATGMIADKGIRKATGAITKGVKVTQALSKADEIMDARKTQEFGLQMMADIDKVDGIVDDIVENPGVIYPPGSEAARLQETIQTSARVPPPGLNPQETRGWFAKFPRPRIFEIGEELGGTKDQLRRIAKEQIDEFNDMENTISELNHMWRVWAEGPSLGFKNSQIVVKKMKDGTERLAIESWKGSDKHWKTFAAFNKDHIRAVINANLPGGGLYGANMAANLEALFAAMNRRKSNIFQLDERILKNIGVPKNAETYIFRKLHPEYTKLERLIPPFWRESYVKNILNDYYEAINKGKLPKKRWNAKMNQLVRKYTHLYRDKAFIEGLEGLQKDLDKLMQSNIAKGISGKEIPEWMENLTMPPGGFNSKDPWWLDLPLAARRRWKRAADQKRIQLMFDPEYRPSKGRYRINPDD